MGTCCSSQSPFRFKNFVVAVYPANDDEGEPNKDALGKLHSYLASNPERVPRVCRKVQKLLTSDLQKGNVRRVGVAVEILRELITSAPDLETLVPYVATIALELFDHTSSASNVEYKIGAADLVATLCHRMNERAQQAEQAKRLFSEHQERFCSYFRDMTIEGVGTSDIISLHCRYAGIVALGNLASCCRTTMSLEAQRLLAPVLTNLQYLLKETVEGNSSRINQRRRQRHENLSGCIDDDEKHGYRLTRTVVLPVDASEKDHAYFRACTSTVAALASCCTTTTVAEFLDTTSSFLTTFHGWNHRRLPVLVYRAIVWSLHQRSQNLSVCVSTHLCETMDATSDVHVVTSSLKCLVSVVLTIPMSGGRPLPLLEAIKSCVSSKLRAIDAAMSSASGELSSATSQDMQQLRVALKALLFSLAKRVTEARNLIQLGRVVHEVVSLLSRTSSSAPPRMIALVLELVAVVAPYLRDLSVEERDRTNLFDALQPWLSSSSGPLRDFAIRVITNVVAGETTLSLAPLEDSTSSPSSPQPPQSSTHSTTGFVSIPSSPATPAPTSSSNADPILPAALRVTPCLSDYGIDEAKFFVSQSLNTLDHTPSSLVELSNVLTALIHRLGYRSLPFVVPLALYLQRRVIESGNGANGTSSSSSGRTGFPQRINGLQQAWLHLSVVLLKVVGEVLELRPVLSYAEDVLRRRFDAEPCEVGIWFQQRLQKLSPTESGLHVVEGEQDTPLSNTPMVPMTTNLITLATLVVYLVETPNTQATMFRLFRVTDAQQLGSELEHLQECVVNPVRAIRKPTVGRGITARGTSAAAEGTSSEMGSSSVLIPPLFPSNVTAPPPARQISTMDFSSFDGIASSGVFGEGGGRRSGGNGSGGGGGPIPVDLRSAAEKIFVLAATHRARLDPTVCQAQVVAADVTSSSGPAGALKPVNHCFPSTFPRAVAIVSPRSTLTDATATEFKSSFAGTLTSLNSSISNAGSTGTGRAAANGGTMLRSTVALSTAKAARLLDPSNADGNVSSASPSKLGGRNGLLRSAASSQSLQLRSVQVPSFLLEL